MNSAFRNILTIYRRELAGHFNSILAYVLIFVFALLSMAMGFVLGAFLDRGDASLAASFLIWHPWLFLLIGPALGMRLWSEEHRSGTIELLLTMPVTPWQAILAKFLASCTVILAALAMTFPIVITVCYLGEPDLGAIFTGYVGSFLVACTMVAIACVVSAFTRSLVACLVVSFAICFALTLIGFDPITQAITDLFGTFGEALVRLSPVSHIADIIRGEARLINIVYFPFLIGFFFLVNAFLRTKTARLVASLTIGIILILIGVNPFAKAITKVFDAASGDVLAGLSMMSHFQDMTRGLIHLNNIMYFVSMIGFCLFVTSVVIGSKRS